jgi:MFS family permease
MIGFALVGIGTAVMVPLASSAGANLGKSGTALTLVLSGGYAGSIAGPAMIGNTADHLGLRVAMGVPLVAALVIIALAGKLHAKPDRVALPSEVTPEPPSRR